MSDIQRTQWFCVINAPYGKTIKQVDNDLIFYLATECDKYYSIIHDKDILDNGELKTPHIHLLVELVSRQRKSTILNRMSKCVNIPLECISVDECRNISKSAQYLIHLNNKEKYQYNKEDISTNDEERLKYLLMSDEKTDLTTDELFDIVDNARNVRELIKKIGISCYMKYGRVIDLLWKDKVTSNGFNYVVKNNFED